MSVGERDPHTGHMTTGHEWNGIKELNTSVPKPVWYCLSSAFVVSVIMWLFLPTWPLVTSYTPGILGIDERAELEEKLQEASEQKSAIIQRLNNTDYAGLNSDEELLNYVRTAGKTLFADNCLVCHGESATGGPGYPSLTDMNWLWGGDEEAVMETLRVGINDIHPDTRYSEMPAFGRDKTLEPKAIVQVIDYLESIGTNKASGTWAKESIEAGALIFEETCSACHGEDGTGDIDVGAPNLKDAYWIYGGDRRSIHSTIWGGRQGHMPAWEGRLSETDRKLLTLYVLDLDKSDNAGN